MPLSISARVSGSSAAMWRYVKSTSPSRRRPYSGAIGSLTLSSMSACSQTSSTPAIRAPTAVYWSSWNALPSPAPVSTSTSWPRRTSSRAPAGVSATRYSSVLISRTTPIFISLSCRLGGVEAQKEQERRERRRVLELAEPLRDLLDRPAHELDLLVLLRRCVAVLDVLREEDLGVFGADPGRREEASEVTPATAGEARLLQQLAFRGLEGRLACAVERPRREL